MESNGVAAPGAGNSRVATSTEPPLDYGWMLVALLAATVIAWAARKIVWQKDSN